MNRNAKKKNAIRFGAIAIAILIFGGVFSVWALSTQATATAGIGSIQVDGIKVSEGFNAKNDYELLEDSVAGRPGSLNASDDNPYELYNISETTDGALQANYTAIVYLANGAELLDAGMRTMILDMNLTYSGTTIGNGTLTMENGKAAFTFNASNYDPANEMTVDIVGGSYSTHPWANFNGHDVKFVIDIAPGQP
ncbi:MAG: hypothetical protein KGY76_09530 [Candidatus Thermoplasmatota archaeon]|nr:hypothetical protein [Candidatus Thermoplasmatota archaeon]